LIAYHSQRLTKSAKLVEEEQWNQIDVTQVMQHNVNLLIEAAVSDPEECFIPPRLPISNGAENGLSRTLDVEEKKFFVVKATAESIGLLRDYLGVVINLEVVVTDVMGRIIEFLKVGSHLWAPLIT
jgi:vacuolar protein sorting-associated protein 54